MNAADFLLDRCSETPESAALIWRGDSFSYGWLRKAAEEQRQSLLASGIRPGDSIVLRADYHPLTIATLLALIGLNAIIVPMTPAFADKSPDLVVLAAPVATLSISADGEVDIARRTPEQSHALYAELRRRGAPGLVLFTSGSTGKPKAVVHDFSLLLRKFHVPRPGMIMLNFLMFDHWGGLNTLLHGLASRSTLVLPEKRVPEIVCELLERHRIQLLPTTPTFLNLFLVSKAYKGRDLSALRIISYGAEPMPSSTLKKLGEVLPNVGLRQTYGLIELGVLNSKSRDRDSLWIKIGGQGYDVRVVDGILQIKAEAAMLGYLNAPSPVTADGYFITGDKVEQQGDYIRILGRDSDLINVGGQKVFPTEVEALLLEHPAIEDALVFGEAHPLTGKIVCADIKLRSEATGVTDERSIQLDIKRYCAARLEAFKVPVKIRFLRDELYTSRLKRRRHHPSS